MITTKILKNSFFKLISQCFDSSLTSDFIFHGKIALRSMHFKMKWHILSFYSKIPSFFEEETECLKECGQIF